MGSPVLGSRLEVDAYVESDVGMFADHAVAAWTFDLALWGTCGQGLTEHDALRALANEVGLQGPEALRVVERIEGDERAFARDLSPATQEERSRTAEILRESRAETIELVARSSPAFLDWDDPDRILPSWADWRTLRQMAWHIADTESRYYLTGVGLPFRPRAEDLSQELRASLECVLGAVRGMPAALLRRDKDAVWTTTKVLRRLAWHERGELVVMREMERKAHRALGLTT